MPATPVPSNLRFALGGRDQVSERRDMPDVDGLPACQSQNNKGKSYALRLSGFPRLCRLRSR
jgi:hypothetical protein